MYTIIFNLKNRSLDTTVKTNIMQKENLVDKIQFLVPPTYNGLDLSNFACTLKYVDPNGAYHVEVLEKDEDTYKDYLRYVLPITTTLSKYIGECKIRLSMLGVYRETEESDLQNFVLNSDSTVIKINKPDGFYDFVDEEDVEALKELMEQLTAKVQVIEDNQVDDIVLTEDEQVLKVSARGKLKGEGVEMSMGIYDEKIDDRNDGTLDLTGNE